MTDEPTVGADDTDIDDETAEPGDSGVAARRSSPSAQAASRARRIGGRPAPGPRPMPTGTATDAPVGVKSKPTKKAAASSKRAKAAPEASAGSDPFPRRGGLRAARSAASERTAEAERTATSLRKRPAPKPTKVAAREPKPKAAHQGELIRWLPAGVLGVAVVVLAVLCYAYGNGVWHGTKSSSEVRGEVLSAAKTCTAKVSSYDYRNLAQAKKDGQACATGKFKKDYTTAMDTIIAKEAPTTKTAQSVQVAKAGVEQVSSDGKQWTLLIYGQHTVTNTTTGTKTPRLDKLSVRVTMDKVGTKWLISKIDLVDG